MKLNIDPEWLKRMAEKEDAVCVTAMSPEIYGEILSQAFMDAADIEAETPMITGAFVLEWKRRGEIIESLLIRDSETTMQLGRETARLDFLESELSEHSRNVLGMRRGETIREAIDRMLPKTETT